MYDLARFVNVMKGSPIIIRLHSTHSTLDLRNFSNEIV